MEDPEAQNYVQLEEESGSQNNKEAEEFEIQNVISNETESPTNTTSVELLNDPEDVHVFTLSGQECLELSSLINLPGPTKHPEDIPLRNLLKSWNQEHLYEVLNDAGIDVEILKIIKWYHIQAVLKNFMISDQILFERNIEQWRKDIGAPLVISFPLSDYGFSSAHSSSMSSIHSLSPSQSPEPNESHISLSTILEEKNRGKQLMEFYKINNCFQQHQRDLLVNLIATYFDENNIHLSLSSSQKLEEEITQMFPSEKTEFYRMGKRGKIYFKYFNLKRNSRKLQPAKRKLISPQKKTNKSFHPETDAETCLNSLKYDNLSVDEFDSLWASCSQFRLNHIFNSTKQTEIFDKWPFYKKPNGYRLIDKDFQTLHPTSTSILSLWQDHWKTLKNFLMENIKDKRVTETLKDLGDTNFGEDDFVLEILKSIHFYLFPTAAVSRKSNTGAKSRSKFTIKDSLMAFIFEGETTQVLEDHIAFLKSRGETIQPLILALRGKNEYFILLDDYKLKTNNVLRAVDICFKCFFLFNLKYPPACENFWDFIELFFYMKTNTIKTKKMNPKLSTMLHTLST